MRAAGALRRPFHPFLLAVIPPLFVWSGSPAEIALRDVLVHVGLGFALAGALLALLVRLLGPVRGALAASLGVIALSWPLDPPIALVLLVLGAIWLLRARRSPAPGEPGRLALFLNGLAATTVATSLVAVALHAAGHPPKRPAPGPIPFAKGARPDLYLIVLDGLARGDHLERRFGVSDLLGPGLVQRGFQVAPLSRANYSQTLYVIASALSLGYVHATSPTGKVTREEVEAVLASSMAAASFRHAGYRTVYWPGGYHRLEPAFDEVVTHGFLPSEFHLAMMNQWPPVGVFRRLSGRSLSASLRHRFKTRMLASLGPVRSGPPRFTFVHVIAPHAPFVVGPDGAMVAIGSSDTIVDGSLWEAWNPGLSYRKGYSGQATWVQPQVLAAVDRILAPGARPAVVVVASDHGSGLGLDLNRPAPEPLRDRMSTLWAIRFPAPPSRPAPETMSLVNTFRYVSDELFGTSLGLLPDRSYWQAWNRPETLWDVTETVHGPR